MVRRFSAWLLDSYSNHQKEFMKYRLLLVTETDDDSIYETIAQISSEAPAPALAAQVKAEVFQTVNRVVNNQTMPDGTPNSVRPGAVKGRPARKILILHFDDPVNAPSGVRIGDIVESSMDLSKILGFNYNMIIQSFAHARRSRAEELKNKSPEERTAILAEPLEAKCRGVTFCYVDEMSSSQK